MARKSDSMWDCASDIHLSETNFESLYQMQSQGKMYAGNRELSK